MPSEAIRQVVDALTSRLRELDDEASHIRALLAHYGVASGVASAMPAANITPHQKSGSVGAKAGRVSDQWRPLWEMMAADGGDIHLDALEDFSTRNALGHDRNKIRNHMHNWKRQGLVTSPAPLVFRAINPETNNGVEPEAPTPLPEIESKDEPETREVVRFDLLHHNAAKTAGGGT